MSMLCYLYPDTEEERHVQPSLETMASAWEHYRKRFQYWRTPWWLLRLVRHDLGINIVADFCASEADSRFLHWTDHPIQLTNWAATLQDVVRTTKSRLTPIVHDPDRGEPYAWLNPPFAHSRIFVQAAVKEAQRYGSRSWFVLPLLTYTADWCRKLREKGLIRPLILDRRMGFYHPLMDGTQARDGALFLEVVPEKNTDPEWALTVKPSSFSNNCIWCGAFDYERDDRMVMADFNDGPELVGGIHIRCLQEVYRELHTQRSG